MADYISDVDGTIADVQHRRHLVQTKPSNWHAFRAAAAQDTPCVPVIKTLQALFAQGNRIVLCSGRVEDERDLTERWMLQHKVWYHKLYMRPNGDYRADDIVKSELLDQILADGFQPIMAFDDRQRVVDMWRRRGIVCAQVAEENF